MAFCAASWQFWKNVSLPNLVISSGTILSLKSAGSLLEQFQMCVMGSFEKLFSKVKLPKKKTWNLWSVSALILDENTRPPHLMNLKPTPAGTPDSQPCTGLQTARRQSSTPYVWGISWIGWIGPTPKKETSWQVLVNCGAELSESILGSSPSSWTFAHRWLILETTASALLWPVSQTMGNCLWRNNWLCRRIHQTAGLTANCNAQLLHWHVRRSNTKECFLAWECFCQRKGSLMPETNWNSSRIEQANWHWNKKQFGHSIRDELWVRVLKNSPGRFLPQESKNRKKSCSSGFVPKGEKTPVLTKKFAKRPPGF